jgi:hypothetical protein
MEDIPFRPTYETEQERKLDVALSIARLASKGTVSFHEYSYKPLTSMFITTGELIVGNDRIHEIETDLVEQHSEYPPRMDSYEDVIKKGYQLFCEANDQTNAEPTGIFRTSYTLTEYKEMFLDVKGVIDRANYANQGIKCYSDGDLNNKCHYNMYYMHVCDIFNIMMHEAENKTVSLLIETSLLPCITRGMKHMLEERLLNCIQRFFLLKNVDIFYIAYGYYFNISFVPIRTLIPKSSVHFKMSSFFMNDEHFVHHQRGKLKEFDDTELNYLTRIIFKTF